MGAPPVVNLLCQRPPARPVSMRSGKIAEGDFLGAAGEVGYGAV